MSETAELAEFVATTAYEDIPDEVKDKAKQCLFNVLGVTIAGSRSPVGDRVANYVQSQYPSDGPVSIVGGGRTSPEGAVLANGTFPSAHHYDDTFSSLIVHPSASAFPSAYAAVEQSGGDGRSLLTGFVVGIETAYHLGGSLDPPHGDHGWHSTGTIGSFGATAAAASVLGLSPTEVQHAFGITASGSSSLRRNIGTNTNQLHTGHAAQLGIRAALLARSGFTADERIFEGSQGYGTVMKPGAEFDPGDMVGSLGETWGTLDVGFKPYPSASISHAALESLLDLLQAESLTGADIDSVTVHLNPSLSNVLDSTYPRDGSDAPASVEYCLAVALEQQSVAISDFTDERVDDDRIKAQWEKITTDFGESLGEEFAKKGARVVVTTVGGEEYVVEQRHPGGSPENPLSDAQLNAKFSECTASADSVADPETFRGVIERLEEREAFQELVELIDRVE